MKPYKLTYAIDAESHAAIVTITGPDIPEIKAVHNIPPEGAKLYQIVATGFQTLAAYVGDARFDTIKDQIEFVKPVNKSLN